MINYCGKQLSSRSKYDQIAQKKCHLIHGHEGVCSEFPFLKHLSETSPRVADKIKRDSTMTTGAAWKSDDAGPNRILRWVMLLPDADLLNYGLDMTQLKPQVIAKLREKSADYDSCIQVAIKLTWLVYQMPNSPTPPAPISAYLEAHFGELNRETHCSICLTTLDFSLFHEAQRGKAVVETCHLDPRSHNATNVGFGHRECNIAQGNKNIEEFYDWIYGILTRANRL